MGVLRCCLGDVCMVCDVNLDSNDVEKSGLVLRNKCLLIPSRQTTLCFFGVGSVLWALGGCGGFYFDIGLDVPTGSKHSF